jgi:hypothetical protein
MAQDDWDGFGVIAIEERKLQTSHPVVLPKGSVRVCKSMGLKSFQ